MNIFATSASPIESARALDDKRVIKMILESTQLLCNALRFHGYERDWMYKKTHMNHPSSVWARTGRRNYIWLCSHALVLSAIYQETYLKVHKSHRIILFCDNNADKIPENEDLTEFPKCITPYDGIGDIDQMDVYTAYKHYLVHKWNNDVRRPTWINRNPPKWLTQRDGKFFHIDTPENS